MYAMKAHGGADVWIRVFLTLALVGGEWVRFDYPRGNSLLGTHWIGCVVPESRSEVCGNEKDLSQSGLELRSVGWKERERSAAVK
jgi:hypothetical protein